MVQTCIEIDSWSAPAHSKLPAVEDGPHLGGDAIRGIKEQLHRQTDSMPPYRVTCVVTKLVTEPTASNEQVMEQVMHYLLFGGKSK